MASQNPWEWDEARQEYYYWDAVSECYVYQHSGPVSPEGTAYQSPQGSAQANVQTNVEDGPPERITEAGALQSGINAHKKIRETPGDREMLDPRFQKHYPGREFYKVGKVFKVLWPEPAGNPQAGVTFITGPETFNEPIFAKIRWFVVIREGRDCCTCLPIQTYNGQGVAKAGVIKEEHSVVYTSSSPPASPDWEDPYGQMLEPIRVVAKNPAESKMDYMSRLNYAKPYTVEHNVKSLDFGDVPRDWLPTLLQNFASALQLGQAQHLGSSPSYTYSSSPTSSRSEQQYPPSNRGSGQYGSAGYYGGQPTRYNPQGYNYQ